MYSVIPSFISADEGPGRHKAWPAAASNRRDGHELQRFLASLEELMFLIGLDEEDDAGAEREFLPGQDCDAATLGYDELMVPFVAVHRRESAFRDDELVHRGLPGSVLVTDQLLHLHVVTAFLQQTDRRDRPDGGRMHVGLRGYPSASLRVCAGRQKDASRIVHDGILDADRLERLFPLAARNARAAMDRVVPVARPRDLERHVQLEAQPDDFLFRLAAQRHENLHGGLVVRPKAEVEDAVQEIEELRARVRERFRVESVVAAHDVACCVELGVVAREAVEDEVPTRDVSFRRVEEEAILEPLLSKVVDLFEERQVHVADRRGTHPGGERSDCIVFALRPAEVVERQRVDVETLFPRPPQGHGGIDAAGQQDDRSFHRRPPDQWARQRIALRAADGTLPPHKYLSQTRVIQGTEKDFRRRAAGAGGTAPRAPRVHPRSLRGPRLATSQGGPRTGLGGWRGDVEGGERCR